MISWSFWRYSVISLIANFSTVLFSFLHIYRIGKNLLRRAQKFEVNQKSIRRQHDLFSLTPWKANLNCIFYMSLCITGILFNICTIIGVNAIIQIFLFYYIIERNQVGLIRAVETIKNAAWLRFSGFYTPHGLKWWISVVTSLAHVQWSVKMIYKKIG